MSAERPGADFVGIDFAVGETSGPQSCITSLGVLGLHIVAIDGEVADAIGKTSTPSGCIFTNLRTLILFLCVLQVESRNVSRISDMACQLAIPSFGLILTGPTFCFIFSALEATIASFYADLAIVPAGSDAVKYAIFIQKVPVTSRATP